jgi:hypothetical protein
LESHLLVYSLSLVILYSSCSLVHSLQKWSCYNP